MYNKEIGCWKSDAWEEAIIAWCQEPYNRESPQAMFILADRMLEEASGGKRTAEAVYLMESAARKGHARAAMAMGQLFQYGWAVSRSKKSARVWYEKAAELGDLEAAALLAEQKRQKRGRILVCALSVLLLAAVVIGAALWLGNTQPVVGVLVHEDTELLQTDNLADFSSALNELVAQYDDELVISGQRGSNRLLLRFEGEGIDLSNFPAAIVIDGGENFLIVQFDSAEEAQRCLEILQQTKGIVFVEEDGYGITADETVTSSDLTSTGVPYTSAYTGQTYLSWGVEYMGMDILASWLMSQRTASVVVAVLDTGSEPCQENADRYLDGYDTIETSNRNGWTDVNGHGTHVAGTILDCTRGLDLKILPVRVLGPYGQPDSCIALGLMYAIQNDVDVINMSLGGPCNHADPGSSCGGVIDSYVQDAVDQGIVVVIAAGNGDDYGNPEDTADNCPAHNDCAIVVAACDEWEQLASFSNYGEAVDVCAPGVAVNSYYIGGSFEVKNGTSMATPHVAALAAMLKMIMPDKSPAQIEKYITDYCVDMGNNLYYGEGIPWAGYFAGD